MSEGPIVLVVDDNPVNLKLTRVLLSGEGYSIYTASCAEDALRLLEAVTPQLILMDIQLPGLDGLELTRMLKRDPQRRDILVFALTAYAMKGDEERARAAGCDGYITKPIDPGRLPDLIARAVSRPAPVMGQSGANQGRVRG